MFIIHIHSLDLKQGIQIGYFEDYYMLIMHMYIALDISYFSKLGTTSK